MPVMGIGFDLLNRVAAELVADHLKLFIKAADAEGHIGAAFLHEFNQAAARGLRVAAAGQSGERRIVKRGLVLSTQP